MTQAGMHTLAEIQSQPATWQAALAAFPGWTERIRALWQAGFDAVIFTGCGSTYYLSLTAAQIFQTLTGVPTRAYPASELVFYPDAVYLPGRKYLLVTVSRSGTTTETLAAERIFREKAEGQVIGIGCYSESPLMQAADLALTEDSAREESVAQTRSFSTMLVLAEMLAAAIGGQGMDHSLPTGVRQILANYEERMRALGEDLNIQRFFFLGSGARYGIACEAMLKMKEMSLSYSEAYHALEFRHGPMSMVDERTLVIGLLGDETCEHEAAVLRDMQARGAQVLALRASCAVDLADAHVVQIPADGPAWSRPVLYLPALQLLAYYRALANGQNPDQPTNLTAVVSLDNLG
jgi:glutamine---fructose-6-phosphate transaminase (isomerizing)